MLGCSKIAISDCFNILITFKCSNFIKSFTLNFKFKFLLKINDCGVSLYAETKSLYLLKLKIELNNLFLCKYS